MSNETKESAAPYPVRHTAKTGGGKPSGIIVYNPNTDSWRCHDASGRLVLSTGSKAVAVQNYPNFTVKE